MDVMSKESDEGRLIEGIKKLISNSLLRNSEQHIGITTKWN